MVLLLILNYLPLGSENNQEGLLSRFHPRLTCGILYHHYYYSNYNYDYYESEKENKNMRNDRNRLIGCETVGNHYLRSEENVP